MKDLKPSTSQRRSNKLTSKQESKSAISPKSNKVRKQSPSKKELPKNSQQDLNFNRIKDSRGRKQKNLLQLQADSIRKLADWQKQIDTGIDENGK